MRMQIIHCAVAIFEDEEPSGVPEGIVPTRGDDINIAPSSDGLEDKGLAELISMFEGIDLDCTHESPIALRRQYLREALGVDEAELSALLAEGRKQDLLRRLTIEVNHGAWLKKSMHKGCLVVMACVEQGDYDRSDLPDLFCREIIDRRNALVSEKHLLDQIVLMPNAHLTDCLETDSGRAIAVISRLRQKLQESGVTVLIGSFGFGKRVKLVIMGHRKAYSFRKL